MDGPVVQRQNNRLITGMTPVRLPSSTAARPLRCRMRDNVCTDSGAARAATRGGQHERHGNEARSEQDRAGQAAPAPAGGLRGHGRGGASPGAKSDSSRRRWIWSCASGRTRTFTPLPAALDSSRIMTGARRRLLRSSCATWACWSARGLRWRARECTTGCRNRRRGLAQARPLYAAPIERREHEEETPPAGVLRQVRHPAWQTFQIEHLPGWTLSERMSPLHGLA